MSIECLFILEAYTWNHLGGSFDLIDFFATYKRTLRNNVDLTILINSDLVEL